MDVVVCAADASERALLATVIQQADVTSVVADTIEDIVERWSDYAADGIVLALPHGDPMDVVRRIRSVAIIAADDLQIDDLTLDVVSCTVQRPNRPAQRLTYLECRLLHALMRHHGQTLPTEILIERVWGYTSAGDRNMLRKLILCATRIMLGTSTACGVSSPAISTESSPDLQTSRPAVVALTPVSGNTPMALNQSSLFFRRLSQQIVRVWRHSLRESS